MTAASKEAGVIANVLVALNHLGVGKESERNRNRKGIGRFVAKSGLKIMKKGARDGPGAVRRGGACGGSPGAEKGSSHYGLLGEIFDGFSMFFLRRHFS